VILEHSVVICRSTEDVFSLLGNPDNDPRWGSLVLESEQVSPGPVAPGSIFRQTAGFMGARITTEIEITEFKSGERLCYRASQPLSIRHCRTVVGGPDGTTLTFSTEIEPGGRFAMAESLLRGFAERQMAADMEQIKELLER
jgi:hypothetical protein